MDGINSSDTTVNYSTIVVSPGEHGVFTSDNTTASKTFTGPLYTGFTMDVTAVGAYRLTGWETTLDSSGILYMTAHWVEDELVSSTIYNFKSGSYYYGKDYVNSITINVSNSSSKSTYGTTAGTTLTEDENQISNEERSVSTSASYDLYVNGEYWKTISCNDTYTGYGTKSEVTKVYVQGCWMYSYMYTWSVTASTTVTFDEPVRYLTIVANTIDKSADVTIERYVDE